MTNQEHVRFATAWGWPLLSMWNGWQADGPVNATAPKLHDSCVNGIPMKRADRIRTYGGYSLIRALPLGIIWPGFILDALINVFALLTAFILLSILFQGRRRSRASRGLCIKCAYNLTGITSSRCPECGWIHSR
ncbi:MAG TPA: hypothetical protein VG711_09630 [Phycisphaerales bacterium]|nr:hypothetical protein [Phycisphaerales bacterium]